MDKMKTDLDISEKQVEGAVIIVRNKLFDQKWKFYEECKNKVDLDSLP